jgi:hypothetical protein
MRYSRNIKLILSIASCTAAISSTAAGFGGRIHAVMTRGNETNSLLYTIGLDHLRIEVTAADSPRAINLVDLKSGAVTLVFPHNRSFVRLKDAGIHAPSRVPADAASAGVGPEARPTAPEAGALPTPHRVGPTNLPGMPAMPNIPPGIGPPPAGAGAFPAMPAMPMPMMGKKLELQATTNTTTILGFPCVRYELKQHGETMEIWATDKLLPYRGYLRDQPPRFGPRVFEAQWPDLLASRKLFPLRASLRLDNGAERFRFEVKSVTPEAIADERLFKPPADYYELEPLPF